MNTTARLSLIAALLAGAGMVSTSAMAATAVGTASATVLTPIAITAGAALNFGTFAANASGGTVVMTSGGVRSGTGTVVLTTGSTGGAGAFTVTGTGNATFAITYPPAFNVTSGADTMSVTVSGAATGTLAGGTVALPVGGTLTVGAAQAAGSYSATYNLVVEYN